MKRKNTVIFIAVLCVVVAWSILLYFVPPAVIVDFIGAHNSYWVLFLMAIIGGVSGITSTSFYATYITFVLGGADMFTLSILAGIGMTSGDIIFYFLGKKGIHSLSDKMLRHVKRFESWLQKVPEKFVPIFIFLYSGFTIFPGDVLSVLLGVGKYPFKKILLPFILGNITFMILIGLLAQKGVDVTTWLG